MPDCKSCKEARGIVEPVPYIVHEAAQARSERVIRRLVAIVIILISMLFVSNAIWMYEWGQFEYVVDSVDLEQDGDGTNVGIVGDGNTLGGAYGTGD